MGSNNSGLVDYIFARKRKGIILCFLFFVLIFLYYNRSESNNSNIEVQTFKCPQTNTFPSKKYAIMLDAGSTGSRIHIYEILMCDDQVLSLQKEHFHEVKPGLSSFSSPAEAASSIDPLLEKALQIIPLSHRKCSPISLKATAGLRLLSNDLAKIIINQIRENIKRYPFLIPKKDGDIADVIEGSEEGIFAWITVNFLLNHFGTNSLPSLIMDLGGASTQIVFESNLPFDPKYYEKMKLYGKDYNLYQHSFLGFGLMEARKKIISEYLSRRKTDDTKGFACFSNIHSEKTPLGILEGKGSNPAECLSYVKEVFPSTANCDLKPCTFNGIHLPDIDVGEIYAFSYFYDRTEILNLPAVLKVKDFSLAFHDICSITTEHQDHQHYDKFTENPYLCLDLAYIYGLLKFAYRLPDDKEIRLAKKIQGYETGWALGASLKLIQDYKCT